MTTFEKAILGIIVLVLFVTYVMPWLAAMLLVDSVASAIQSSSATDAAVHVAQPLPHP